MFCFGKCKKQSEHDKKVESYLWALAKKEAYINKLERRIAKQRNDITKLIINNKVKKV